MSTVKRHGEKFIILEGGVLQRTFHVDADGEEWFGGWVVINARNQKKMDFFVPIGYWSPIFEKPRAGFGSVPCGNLKEFSKLLNLFTMVAKVTEAIVYEQVPQKNSDGKWTPERKDYELFRITHDWK
jgi:hypothetical protein